MRHLIAGMLLLLAAAAQGGPRQEAQALVAGEPAFDPPWMGALLRARYDDPYVGQFCGATLIAPAWALTAAHCVHDPALGEIDLLVGTAELRRDRGSRHRVAEILIHPGFVPPDGDVGFEFDNDIALLRLAEEVSGIEPVALAGPEFDVMNVKAGTPATLLGWGALAFDNEARRATDFPIDLKQVSVPIVSHADCLDVMGDTEVTANMLCAGTPDLGADSCVGDSGGPLAVARGGDWLQVGIISWGLGCAMPGFYGVYTRLGKYADWISARVCEAEELPPRPLVTALNGGAGRVILEWQRADADTGYRVYYRPSLTRSPIRHFDAGNTGRFLSAAPPGVAFDVAVQGYRGPCNGKFSVIRSFILRD